MTKTPELLAAGPALDEEVAGALSDIDTWPERPRPVREEDLGTPWPWSTDPVAATKLVDTLIVAGWSVQMNAGPTQPWECALSSPKFDDGVQWDSEAEGETWMLAFCRALVREADDDG